ASSPSRVRKKTCRAPATLAATGEEQLASSPVAFQTSLPLARSNATMPALRPPTLTKSRLPSAIGDVATPKKPLRTAYSSLIERCQNFFPVARSRQCNVPSEHNVNTETTATSG